MRITIGEEYDLLVPRTAERFVVASHRLPEPAKDAEIQIPLDLVKQKFGIVPDRPRLGGHLTAGSSLV
jgi:hypothetical protein